MTNIRSTTEDRLYTLADDIGRALTRLAIYDMVITPFNLDRIATANAKKFVKRLDFDSQAQYEAVLSTFASAVATSYMKQVKQNVSHAS